MKIDIMSWLCDEFPDVLDDRSDYVKESIKEFPNFEIHLKNMQELDSKDKHYIEKSLLREIVGVLSKLGYDQSCEYFAAITNKFSAYVRDGKEKVIIIDESFNSGLIEFYLLILGWARDVKNKHYFEYSMQNLICLFDMHCIKRKLGTIDPDIDKYWYNNLEQNIQEISSDCYWISWCFMVLHELGHLILGHTTVDSSVNQEFEADEFAYNILLQLIKKNHAINNGPLAVFKEYTCFAPCMLFEFYKAINSFQQLIYPKVEMRFRPNPQERIERLLETEIEDIDISEANDVYNNLLNVIDVFFEQLIIKYDAGKLDVLPHIL